MLELLALERSEAFDFGVTVGTLEVLEEALWTGPSSGPLSFALDSSESRSGLTAGLAFLLFLEVEDLLLVLAIVKIEVLGWIYRKVRGSFT